MKKKVIFIIIACFILVALIIGYMYTKTDLFKTDQQLFWKYAVKNNEMIDIFNNENISNVQSKKINNSYKVDSNLNIVTKDGTYNIQSKTNAKNLNDVFTYVDFTKDSNEIIDFNLIKKSNVVGIKMDELANGYITLKNSDLKSLISKIDINDYSKFPDNINFGNYIDVLQFSQEDINYITDKYTKLIISDTNKNNYSKNGTAGIKINNKIHTANAYKLKLSENESKKILEDIFFNLSTDSRTLNIISSKLKMLNLPNEYTQINLLSDKFKEIGENINAIQTTDNDLLEIIVYEEKSELIQTSIKIGNDRLIKVICEKENGIINIKQEILDESVNGKFVLSISDLMDKVLNNIEEVNILNEVKDDNSIISTSIDVKYENSDIKYTSLTEITNNIEENNDYEGSIKINLNNLTENQLKNFYNALIKTVSGLYQEKKNIIFSKSQ